MGACSGRAPPSAAGAPRRLATSGGRCTSCAVPAGSSPVWPSSRASLGDAKVVRGWVGSPDGRHHGAHYAEAALALGARPDGFLDFSANINPLGPPAAVIAAGAEALHVETESYPDLHYRELRAALA